MVLNSGYVGVLEDSSGVWVVFRVFALSISWYSSKDVAGRNRGSEVWS